MERINTKKESIYAYLCAVLLVINIVLIVILGLTLKSNKKEKSASKILSENINSIVEVKAYTNDVGESFGSGVIYDKNGYLLTNYHVISYTKLGSSYTFENLEIRFANKDDYQTASLIKYDSMLDLAILKINDESKKYSKVSFSKSKYTFGDKVYAIGNTSNYGIGISQGLISVPEVNVIYNDISRLVIQSDINIASGNSGGALLDKRGNLIGITTFRTKDLSNNVNYGFAYSIPIKIIKKFIGE